MTSPSDTPPAAHTPLCDYWKPIPEGKIALPCNCGADGERTAPRPSHANLRDLATHWASGVHGCSAALAREIAALLAERDELVATLHGGSNGQL